MTEESWLILVLGVAVALVLGFFLGRRFAPTQEDVAAAQKERDEASAEVERVRGEVARHFEESASMFGRLANDYRSFFEHFAETAQNLGLSEGRARELLRQADPKLVADQSGDAAASATEGGTEPPPGPVEPAGMPADEGGFEAGTPVDIGEEPSPAEDRADADAGEDAESPDTPRGS